MPAQSHGARIGAHSKSAPNLAALRALSSGDETDNEPSQSPGTRDPKAPVLPSIERQTSSGSHKAEGDDDDDNGSGDRTYGRDMLSDRSSASASSDPEEEEEEEEAEEEGEDEGEGEGEAGAEENDTRPPGVRQLKRINTDPTQRPSSSSGLLSPPPSGSMSGRSTPKRPLYTSRSQSYLGPPSFAPPFYNRPPTPLPPSPSLTSLLRPPFSALPSRPTTPDSSDTEATNLTAATSVLTSSATGTTSTAAGAVARSALTATTVPRATPKIPTYEYYGFLLYLGSSAAFLMYLLWSYLPQPFLHQLGIYYYPNRWWSLAIPSWLVLCVVYIYVALAAYNTGHLTLPMGHIECLVDEAADVAVVDAKGRIVRKKHRKPPFPREQAPKLPARTAGSLTDSAKQAVSRTKQKAAAASAQRSLHAYTHEESPALQWSRVWAHGTDGVMDVPIGGVCEVLYGDSTDSASDEDASAVVDT